MLKKLDYFILRLSVLLYTLSLGEGKIKSKCLSGPYHDGLTGILKGEPFPLNKPSINTLLNSYHEFPPNKSVSTFDKPHVIFLLIYCIFQNCNLNRCFFNINKSISYICRVHTDFNTS